MTSASGDHIYTVNFKAKCSKDKDDSVIGFFQINVFTDEAIQITSFFGF